MINKKKGTYFGLIIGDALGAPLEFVRRDFKNISDMTTGGYHNVSKGEWTDDTSMMLAIANSLINLKTFSLEDQLKEYVKWFKNGKYSTRNNCFDIGLQTKGSLEDYIEKGSIISEYNHFNNSGNGSVMRLAPINIKYASTKNIKELLYYSRRSSLSTHPNKICQEACVLLSIIINRCFNGLEKKDILYFNDKTLSNYNIKTKEIKEIAKGSYINKKREDISSSGYVVSSLEASIWAFNETDNFNDALLLAVNLGNDADTVGAITGQIAGAYYGYNNINKDWLNSLLKLEMLEETFTKLISV